MFKAFLFDLDGTLLDIDMEVFLKHYFNEMGRMALEHGCPDTARLIKRVYGATGVMIGDRSRELFNEEVFMSSFFSDWEHPREATTEFFAEFYREGFPRLQKYCAPFPGIPEMMAGVFDRGAKVVIATNAVFPVEAIEQRLDWAGVGHFPYELITTYENMHFCKPHREYYEEIAERIGVAPQDCLMVGNDTGEDLVAAAVGMKTFLVEDRLIDRGRGHFPPDWRGRLPDLFAFLAGL